MMPTLRSTARRHQKCSDNVCQHWSLCGTHGVRDWLYLFNPTCSTRNANNPMSNPKGPCTCVVYTWALKGFPYHYVGVYVCTRMILGPFGLAVFRIESFVFLLEPMCWDNVGL